MPSSAPFQPDFALSQKKVLLMVGFPGSGKSTLAEQLCQALEAEYLSSDGFRKQLFDSARYDTRGDEAVQEMSKQAYQMMYQKAIELVGDGQRVVLDATHLDVHKRQSALETLLDHISVDDVGFVFVTTPQSVIEMRMKQLQSESNEADETENMYQAWKRVYQVFLERQQRGLIRWPTPFEGIDIFHHEDIELD